MDIRGVRDILRVLDPKNTPRIVAACCVVYFILAVGVASNALFFSPGRKAPEVTLEVLITVELDGSLMVTDSLYTAEGDKESFMLRALPYIKASPLRELPLGNRTITAVSLDGMAYEPVTMTYYSNYYVWPKLPPEKVAENGHLLETSYAIADAVVKDGSERKFIIGLGHFGKKFTLDSLKVTLLLKDSTKAFDPGIALFREDKTGLVQESKSETSALNSASLSTNSLKEKVGQLYVIGSWVGTK